MHVGLKVGLGVGTAALLGGGAVVALRGRDEREVAPVPSRGFAPNGGTSPGDEPYPGTDPYPGGGTSTGDDPLRMPIRGHVDPPGIWDDYGVTGSLSGTRLEATMDPRGWGNDIDLRGTVDHGGFRTEVDPAGWGNTTSVQGRRTGSGFAGTVDRPGLWNDVNHVVSETMRGADVVRHGRFDESLVPSFSEASWRSSPNGSNIDGRTLEFDPPGWGNTTRVTIESNAPAGVESTIAAALFDQWKTEQERVADYPDPNYPVDSYPGGTSPGDDGYPTGPGDDGGYPGSYPTGPGGGVYDPYPSIDEYPRTDLPPFS